MTSEELTESIRCAIFSLRSMEKKLPPDIYAYFPKVWDFGDPPSDGFNGPPPDDAGTIYVIANEKRLFSFSLSYLVDDFLDGVRTPTGEISEEHLPAAHAIMDALQAAANRIERAMSEAP